MVAEARAAAKANAVELEELRAALDVGKVADEAAALARLGFPIGALPEGMTQAEFGRLVWGVRAEGARALIGRTAEELRALGVGLDASKAEELRRFYLNEFMRNPKNLTAAARVELLDDIARTLEGGT